MRTRIFFRQRIPWARSKTYLHVLHNSGTFTLYLHYCLHLHLGADTWPVSRYSAKIVQNRSSGGGQLVLQISRPLAHLCGLARELRELREKLTVL